MLCCNGQSEGTILHRNNPSLRINFVLLFYTFIGLLCIVPCGGRLVQLNSCQATLNGLIINLQPLQQLDNTPRFHISHDGWNYTFNPCGHFDLPSNPEEGHEGHGDQCSHAMMCKSRQNNDEVEYYTMGLKKSARFQTRHAYQWELVQDLISSEEDEDGSSSDQVEMADEDDASNITANDINVTEGFEITHIHNLNVTPPAMKTANISLLQPAYQHERILTEEERAQRRIHQGPGKERVGSRRGTWSKHKKGKKGTKRDHSRVKRLTDKFNSTVSEILIKLTTGDDTTPQKGDHTDPVHPVMDEHGKVIVLRMKGIKTLRRHHAHIFLVCDPDLIAPEDAVFKYINVDTVDKFFLLHHKCSCPGGCPTNHILPSNKYRHSKKPREHIHNNTKKLEVDRLNIINNESLPDVAQIKEIPLFKGESPKHIWIILVANFGILSCAILIGGMCCRKSSGYRPYNMLPGLHSSALTMNSAESMMVSTRKFPSPKYLDYSSSRFIDTTPPQLSNVVISSKLLDIGQRLGGGLFGDTYLAEWNERTVAVKRITVGVHQNQLTGTDHNWLTQEISYLSKQRHKNVVALMGICLDLRQPYIVNEYVDGETLKDLLTRQVTREESMTWPRMIKILQGAAEGMAFLHSAKKPILHRDLRCANVLLNKNEKAKIADYGVTKLAQQIRKECDGRKGCYCQKESSALPASIRWTAPEILENPQAEETHDETFTFSCDVYSFGMMLWEVPTCADPFEDIEDENEVSQLVVNGVRPPIEKLPNVLPRYAELAMACWHHNPEARPKFKEVCAQLKSVAHTLHRVKGKPLKRTESSKLVDGDRARADSTTASYLTSMLNMA